MSAVLSGRPTASGGKSVSGRLGVRVVGALGAAVVAAVLSAWATTLLVEVVSIELVIAEV